MRAKIARGRSEERAPLSPGNFQLARRNRNHPEDGSQLWLSPTYELFIVALDNRDYFISRRCEREPLTSRTFSVNDASEDRTGPALANRNLYSVGVA